MIGLRSRHHPQGRGRQGQHQPQCRARRPTPSPPLDEPPLEALRALVAESQADVPEGLPSTAAGIYGYLGYDMVRLMEVLPDRHADESGTARRDPDAPDGAGDVRYAQGRALPHRAGLCARRASRPGRPGKRAQGRIDDAIGAARPHPALRRRPARHRRHRGHLATPRRPNMPAWSQRPRTTSAPATSSRWC